MIRVVLGGGVFCNPKRPYFVYSNTIEDHAMRYDLKRFSNGLILYCPRIFLIELTLMHFAPLRYKRFPNS